MSETTTTQQPAVAVSGGNRSELEQDLSALETVLIQEGRKKLADKVHLFNEKKLGSVETLQLEKQLARTGKHEAALRIRKGRIEMDENQTVEILSGSRAAPPELLKLAKRLASAKRIGLARRLLKLARKDLKKS